VHHVRGIFTFRWKAGATVGQDATGNITRREVCESNVSNDTRECVDWNTGKKYHDMKNTKGDWVQVVE
jgi:hypothetical protein